MHYVSTRSKWQYGDLRIDEALKVMIFELLGDTTSNIDLALGWD